MELKTNVIKTLKTHIFYLMGTFKSIRNWSGKRAFVRLAFTTCRSSPPRVPPPCSGLLLSPVEGAGVPLGVFVWACFKSLLCFYIIYFEWTVPFFFITQGCVNVASVWGQSLKISNCVCVHRRLTKWSEKRTSNRPTLRNSWKKLSARWRRQTPEHWDSMTQLENHREEMIRVQNLPENHHNFKFSLASK